MQKFYSKISCAKFHCPSGITWPGLTFKAIYNYTYKNKSAFNNFLYTSNLYPNQ